MIPKLLQDIEAVDLQDLVTGGRPEGRTIDYKSELPGASDEEKRRFLYDVTAMANTVGGDIVYGVEEQRAPDGKNSGIPKTIIGVSVASREQEEQRLDSILRSGVDPRIPGVSIRWVSTTTADRPTLVLRVPRSPLGPHMVSTAGLTRFYGRATSGNFVMDVREIRAAFELSGDIGRRLQAFRVDRLIQIAGGEPIVELEGRARLVLHVVPLSFFEIGARIDLSGIRSLHLLMGQDVSADVARYNVDGYVGYRKNVGYVQVFTSGAIEAVDSYLMQSGAQGKIPSELVERAVVVGTRDYVHMLESAGARPPFFVAVALTGVRGRGWAVAPRTHADILDAGPTFDRDQIVLPETLIDANDSRLWSLKVRPLIDGLWQAAGRKGSYSYTSERWEPGRGQI